MSQLPKGDFNFRPSVVLPPRCIETDYSERLGVVESLTLLEGIDAVLLKMALLEDIKRNGISHNQRILLERVCDKIKAAQEWLKA